MKDTDSDITYTSLDEALADLFPVKHSFDKAVNQAIFKATQNVAFKTSRMQEIIQVIKQNAKTVHSSQTVLTDLNSFVKNLNPKTSSQAEYALESIARIVGKDIPVKVYW